MFTTFFRLGVDVRNMAEHCGISGVRSTHSVEIIMANACNSVGGGVAARERSFVSSVCQ